MKTARGVYYNLSESEYTITISGIKFYFSSLVKLNKFKKAYESEVVRFNNSLNRVYKNKFCIEMDSLALIRLYTLIETNGFYLLYKGVMVKCPEDLIFVGMINLRNKLES